MTTNRLLKANGIPLGRVSEWHPRASRTQGTPPSEAVGALTTLQAVGPRWNGIKPYEALEEAPLRPEIADAHRSPNSYSPRSAPAFVAADDPFVCLNVALYTPYATTMVRPDTYHGLDGLHESLN
ncbi:uncharacterized protein PHACADRAFT_213606 [Phanerochaete carnosa HHB-10118-sp]|uniref:Uncharacterized protein n=1 Tax=Phanerochaete carnosa (strain HHB-10118-sp) TaxID=650164 RepID=K5VVV4_PHACS|nr:uncharacterized protein PHACADRAFT_213606 [Phanerochaete carnosa HHB-10118-sp]EKM50714.1 hypothetical protein PHACADRAFT_213606 [Phanerochaete carnosa HHB-10118-sp]